jgi:Protein of unknown function (DUF1186)
MEDQGRAAAPSDAHFDRIAGNVMGAYGPPVDQLLRIGDDLRYHGKDWHDYIGMGIGTEHVPDLIRMAVDNELNRADSDSPEVWAPIHAWRALGVLRAEPAIPTLVGILENQDEVDVDDWVTEEMPRIFGMIGPAAIFDLTRLVADEDASEYSRGDAANGLVEIAKQHPEARNDIVSILARVLERAEWNERSFNGFLVSDLVDLEANEAAEVIERAYAGKFVDDSICGTWYDVWHSLELEGEPPPQTERLDRIGPFPFLDEFLEEPPALFANPSSWQPTELKSADERKDRNKDRQKLEKKVKGKGKGSKRR